MSHNCSILRETDFLLFTIRTVDGAIAWSYKFSSNIIIQGKETEQHSVAVMLNLSTLDVNLAIYLAMNRLIVSFSDIQI